MSKHGFIIILGIVVVLIPHLGFPREWEPWIFAGFGLCIVVTELFRVARSTYDDVVSDRERKRISEPDSTPAEPESRSTSSIMGLEDSFYNRE